MRKGSLSREQAIAIVGLEAVEQVERKNCAFSNRVQADGDEGVEFTASVDAFDKDGLMCVLTAYYYQPQAALDAAGDDLSNCDWSVNGYEVV